MNVCLFATKNGFSVPPYNLQFQFVPLQWSSNQLGCAFMAFSSFLVLKKVTLFMWIWRVWNWQMTIDSQTFNFIWSQRKRELPKITFEFSCIFWSCTTMVPVCRGGIHKINSWLKYKQLLLFNWSIFSIIPCSPVV